MTAKSTAELAAATMSPPELARARDVCERSAATLAAVLDEVRAVNLAATGSFGPKIESRIELASERLAWCAIFFGRQLAKAESGKTAPATPTWGELRAGDV
jgi:hypothetical protein